MAAAGPHISISAETLFSLGPLHVNNSMLTSWIVSGLLIAFAFAVSASLKKTDRPRGIQNLAEMIIEGLHDLIQSVTSDINKTRTFFPMIATFFLFILMNNWFGLLPGVGTIGFKHTPGHASNFWNVSFQTANMHLPDPAKPAYAATPVTPAAGETHAAETAVVPHEETTVAGSTTPQEASDHEAVDAEASHEVFVPYFRAGTADLNMTLALGILSVGAVQFFGFKYVKLAYLKKFFNFSNPINFFVGILELVSEFSKILSFAFRLFGNVFAGEVLLAVVSFIVAFVAPMPFYGLEIFVGFIQALVFSMLSVVLFNMATASHDEH